MMMYLDISGCWRTLTERKVRTLFLRFFIVQLLRFLLVLLNLSPPVAYLIFNLRRNRYLKVLKLF